MKLGQRALEALQAEIRGRLAPDDEVAVAGAAALAGTVLIARQERSRLESFFSRPFVEDCLRLEELYGYELLEEAPEAAAFYALGEGGVLSGIWKMAEASGVGLSIQLRKIPIRQETIEVCEYFDLNPYRLFSRGAVLMGGKNVRVLTEKLVCRGVPAAVIGRAVKGNARLLYSGENARYLERPMEDEIRKVLKKGETDCWKAGR